MEQNQRSLQMSFHSMIRVPNFLGLLQTTEELQSIYFRLLTFWGRDCYFLYVSAEPRTMGLNLLVAAGAIAHKYLQLCPSLLSD